MHVDGTQLLFWQAPVVQSVFSTHATHSPLPLHTFASLIFALHGAPIAVGVTTGVPVSQTPAVHGFPSSGRSESFGITLWLPCPSHTFCVQFHWTSCCMGVPSGVKVKPHSPSMHARFWQSVSSPGQRLGVHEVSFPPAPSPSSPSQPGPLDATRTVRSKTEASNPIRCARMMGNIAKT